MKMNRLLDVGRKFALVLGFFVSIIVGGYIVSLPGELIDAWFDDTVEVTPEIKARFNTPAMKAEAKWLYDANEKLSDLSIDVEAAGMEQELIVMENDGASLSEWSLSDRQQMKQWQQIMDRSHEEYNVLARQYNARMKAFLESVPDGIDFWDLNYQLLFGLPKYHIALEIWSEQ